jgi:hypothetical protein
VQGRRRKKNKNRQFRFLLLLEKLPSSLLVPIFLLIFALLGWIGIESPHYRLRSSHEGLKYFQ